MESFKRLRPLTLFLLIVIGLLALALADVIDNRANPDCNQPPRAPTGNCIEPSR